MEKLFSYGTLQLKPVQFETFGRELSGESDALGKYTLVDLLITDEEIVKTSGQRIHPILSYTGNDKDEIEGTIFEVSSSELAAADEYEVDDYVRKKLRFKSGAYAWAYVALDNEEVE